MINLINYIKEFIWIKKQTKYLKEKNIYIIKLEYKNSLNIPYNNKWVAILDTEKKDLKKILQKDYTFSYRWNTNSVLFKNTKIEIIKETLKYLKIKMLVNNYEFWDKYKNNLLTIEDQEEALKKPWWSLLFALRKIPSSDIKALQDKACKDPWYAYHFAKNITGADIKYCQKYACKDPIYAYYFARDIPSADKKYCFKHVYPEDEFGPNRWKSEYKKFIMKKACE